LTVVIPFSEPNISTIEATLSEVLKIRHALLEAYHAKYFPDKFYSSISELREAHVEVGSELQEYWEVATREAETAVAEKIQIVLLHEDTSHRLSKANQEVLSLIANQQSGCDVIDCGGDRQTVNPRQAVRQDVLGSRLLFFELGTLLSDKEAASLLVRNTA
jgi:hypothetical protein